MADLYVTEYANLARDGQGNEIAAPEEPAVSEQNRTIGVAAASFTAFNGRTRFVRLHAEAACHVNFDGAATASSKRMEAGQTEFFGVAPGTALVLSVIQD